MKSRAIEACRRVAARTLGDCLSLVGAASRLMRVVLLALVAMTLAVASAVAEPPPVDPVPGGGGGTPKLPSSIAITKPTPTAGAGLTVTATVNGTGLEIPTGTVSFKIGSDTVSATLSGNSATASMPALSAGDYDVSAVYSGDANYERSSDQVSFTVMAAEPKPAESKTFTIRLTPLELSSDIQINYLSNYIVTVVQGKVTVVNRQIPNYTVSGSPSSTNSYAAEPLQLNASLSAIRAAAGQEESSPLDLWLNGTFGALADASTEGSFAVGSIGADYLLSPNLTAGVALTFDRLSLSEADGGPGTVDGSSMTITPYIEGKLAQNLSYNLTGGLGWVTNELSPLGTYTDTVRGMRWLFAASLSGSFDVGDLRFAPVLSASYVEQASDAYTDGASVAHAASTMGSGSLAVAPQVSRSFTLGDGSSLTLSGKLRASLDVARDGDDWSFSGFNDGVGAGLAWTMPGGATLSLNGDLSGLVTGGTLVLSGTAGLSAPLR